MLSLARVLVESPRSAHRRRAVPRPGAHHRRRGLRHAVRHPSVGNGRARGRATCRPRPRVVRSCGPVGPRRHRLGGTHRRGGRRRGDTDVRHLGRGDTWLSRSSARRSSPVSGNPTSGGACTAAGSTSPSRPRCAAIDDAGLTVDDIDGVSTYPGIGRPVRRVLGRRAPRRPALQPELAGRGPRDQRPAGRGAQGGAGRGGRTGPPRRWSSAPSSRAAESALRAGGGGGHAGRVPVPDPLRGVVGGQLDRLLRPAAHARLRHHPRAARRHRHQRPHQRSPQSEGHLRRPDDHGRLPRTAG